MYENFGLTEAQVLAMSLEEMKVRMALIAPPAPPETARSATSVKPNTKRFINASYKNPS